MMTSPSEYILLCVENHITQHDDTKTNKYTVHTNLLVPVELKDELLAVEDEDAALWKFIIEHELRYSDDDTVMPYIVSSVSYGTVNREYKMKIFNDHLK